MVFKLRAFTKGIRKDVLVEYSEDETITSISPLVI